MSCYLSSNTTVETVVSEPCCGLEERPPIKISNSGYCYTSKTESIGLFKSFFWCRFHHLLVFNPTFIRHKLNKRGLVYKTLSKYITFTFLLQFEDSLYSFSLF